MNDAPDNLTRLPSMEARRDAQAKVGQVIASDRPSLKARTKAQKEAVLTALEEALALLDPLEAVAGGDVELRDGTLDILFPMIVGRLRTVRDFFDNGGCD